MELFIRRPKDIYSPYPDLIIVADGVTETVIGVVDPNGKQLYLKSLQHLFDCRKDPSCQIEVSDKKTGKVIGTIEIVASTDLDVQSTENQIIISGQFEKLKIHDPEAIH